ncbi:MAG: PilX N-terminal domain-containing pilus assembly protein [Gemmatimonadales bacterium]
MAISRQQALRWSNRRGFVLPTVIFAITIMSVIAVVALTTATDERRASRGTRESTLAMYAAEAGLRQTYGAWPSAAVSALNPGDSLDLGWQNLPNKAAYRAVIHRVDGGGLQEYSVIVQGRRTDPTAGIIMIVGAAGGVPMFKYAVRTEDELYVTTGGPFDAFDSEVGPYVVATADSMANLWANGNMKVTNTTVKGSASAAGTFMLGTDGVVTGATTSGASAQTPMDILSCPAGGYTPTAQVPGGTGISYNATTGVVTVSGGATLTLPDTSYFFRSIVLTGNSKLVFPGNPRASVYLRDSLNAGGGMISNQSANASMLSFASCGTSVTPADWSLNSEGPASYYSVYAPNHTVYELGAGDFYGAVIAYAYYSAGGGKFHYDQALARQPSSKMSVQRGSWAQLAGS